jgi:hypothetical protein
MEDNGYILAVSSPFLLLLVIVILENMLLICVYVRRLPIFAIAIGLLQIVEYVCSHLGSNLHFQLIL